MANGESILDAYIKQIAKQNDALNRQELELGQRELEAQKIDTSNRSLKELAGMAIVGTLPAILGQAFGGYSAGAEGARIGARAASAYNHGLTDKLEKEKMGILAEVQLQKKGIFENRKGLINKENLALKEGLSREGKLFGETIERKSDLFKASLEKDLASNKEALREQREKNIIEFKSKYPAPDKRSSSITLDEKAAEILTPKDPKLAQELFGKYGFRALDMLRIGGHTQENLPAKTRERVIRATVVDSKLAPIMSRIDELTQGKTAGSIWKDQVIFSKLPLTTQQLLQSELDRVAQEMAADEQGRAASDADIKVLKNYISGATALSLGETKKRLQRIVDIAKESAQADLNILANDPAYDRVLKGAAPIVTPKSSKLLPGQIGDGPIPDSSLIPDGFKLGVNAAGTKWKVIPK